MVETILRLAQNKKFMRGKQSQGFGKIVWSFADLLLMPLFGMCWVALTMIWWKALLVAAIANEIKMPSNWNYTEAPKNKPKHTKCVAPTYHASTSRWKISLYVDRFYPVGGSLSPADGTTLQSLVAWNSVYSSKIRIPSVPGLLIYCVSDSTHLISGMKIFSCETSQCSPRSLFLLKCLQLEDETSTYVINSPKCPMG